MRSHPFLLLLLATHAAYGWWPILPKRESRSTSRGVNGQRQQPIVAYAEDERRAWHAAAANLHKVPCAPEVCYPDARQACEVPGPGGRIILLRHGESIWNAENRFTGWHDVPLSPLGERQAAAASQQLANAGLCDIDCVFTSSLKRTIKTAWIVLEELDMCSVPVRHAWQLNERMYGALTGLNKAATREALGEAAFEALRHDPPPIDASSCYYPGSDSRYRDVPRELLPRKESFTDTMERVLPYWESEIVPAAAAGKTVLVIASKNLIRALLMGILPSDAGIDQLDLPNGCPIVYSPQQRSFRAIGPGFSAHTLGVLEALAADRPIA